ncbi:hypothetical protein AAXE64_08350 [Priestia megaterium]
MKIYKVSGMDGMGFENNNAYWSTIEKAKIDYQERYDKLAKSEHLVKNGDDCLENLQENPITEQGKEMLELSDKIRETSFAVWYKTSHEHDEWDIELISISLEELHVDKS